MLAIFNVVLPVFALMAAGYLAVRFKAFPPEGVRGLITFVNSFASPCLLFRGMVTSDFSTAFNWSVIVPFYIGGIASFVVGGLIARRVFKNRPGEAVASGFSATFTNTVLIGIPIVQRAYGNEALTTAFSIIALHAPVFITMGMLTMELIRRDGAPLHRALGVAFLRVAQNPLLWGIVAGVVVKVLNIPLWEPVDAFVGLMAAAVTPAALFGLGGALNEYKLSESWKQSLAMTLLKLLLQPAIAYVLMVFVLHVDHEHARYGVLLAAMPSGINIYVFAVYYNRGINVATSTVLISTVLSVLTISFWLLLLGI